MNLTTEERQLYILYCSDTLYETAAVIKDALKDITEQDVRVTAESLLHKLEDYCDVCDLRWDCYD